MMSRRVNLRTEHAIVAILQEAAVDNVIEVSTIKEYVASVAHAVGMDSDLLPVTTVQRIADEFGIAIKPRAGSVTLYTAMSRIAALEERIEKHAAIISETAQLTLSLTKRVDELERLYVEITSNVVTVTPDNVGEVSRALSQVHKRHDKRA